LTKKTQELARELAANSGTLGDLNTAIRSLMKSALEQMLNTEMDVHLASNSANDDHLRSSEMQDIETKLEGKSQAVKNRRNGHSAKTIQGDLGKLPLEIPRDRNATFEPQLIGKHQRRLAGFDEKILALYAKGMTTRDIQDIVKELYGVDVSPTLISEITEDLDADVKAWQSDVYDERD
jgi:putative transposase